MKADKLGKIEFTADAQGSFTRLDKLLCLRLPDFTRSRIVSLIEGGSVTVNGSTVKKNYCPQNGDSIVVRLPEPVEYDAAPEDIPLDIVFEDSDVVVVNKPKGMVVHPAHGNLSGTLVNALMYHCKGSLSGINGVMRPGIVHRIDKDTSGLIVAAKNDAAHISLAAQFKEHSVLREYRAVVYGGFREPVGVIDRPIGRNSVLRKKMTSRGAANAKNAVTHYEVIEQFSGFSYIKCVLETGRTHQIRVHMSDIGHPLLGDTVYGPSKQKTDFEGQCLHAKTLGFIHPSTGKLMLFDSELPDYFEKALEKLRRTLCIR